MVTKETKAKEKKGFWKRLIEKLDQKVEAKAKAAGTSSCCGGGKDGHGSSCC
jgi:hypothetical protein